MNIRVYTGGEEQILKVSLRVTDPKPQKIRLVVCDADQNNTVFTNRFNVFTGEKSFYVRMPLSPKVSLVQVYNEFIGNRPQKEETTFELLGVERMPLEKKMDVVDMRDPDVRSFVAFALRFCYNAGVMKTGKWVSRDGRFTIDYMPVIMREGKESTTPARISDKTRIIDVSQKIFIPFTVPMRFVILCHEFAHCFRNKNPMSEVEADLQGLLIYLALGFPRIEAHMAFTQTFLGAATELNERRYRIIDKFIDDFENNKTIINE
jgi:hypothetical protein